MLFHEVKERKEGEVAKAGADFGNAADPQAHRQAFKRRFPSLLHNYEPH